MFVFEVVRIFRQLLLQFLLQWHMTIYQHLYCLLNTMDLRSNKNKDRDRKGHKLSCALASLPFTLIKYQIGFKCHIPGTRPISLPINFSKENVGLIIFIFFCFFNLLVNKLRPGYWWTCGQVTGDNIDYMAGEKVDRVTAEHVVSANSVYVGHVPGEHVGVTTGGLVG